ncbi:hypothetical protein B4N89_41265 [Embleya scabrispora]|uniref:NACHT domain-containing protein n=1 Tax=Embleya scabrispora TaxID=159449 RepID=A0A1T3NJJ5_9ACTN|nr:NACHT domain-containing protein [Embleya scabrispora]OPC77013.1 hypothetical protein B4N89_41265 [Embleya scabrispora]
MHPHRSRVAAVFGTGQGSGYLLSPRLILTSAHVVGGTTADAIAIGGAGEVSCDVVWRRKDAQCDAALLMARADLLPDNAPDVFAAPLRWGEFTTLRPWDDGQTIGFPQVQRGDRNQLDTEHVTGRIKPGSSLLRGRYVLEATGTAPDSASAWSGLSGAALFAGTALVAVVDQAPIGWGHGRVEAVPVRVIADDRGFQAAVRMYGELDVVVETLDPVPDDERRDRAFETEYRAYIARRHANVETLGDTESDRIVLPLDSAFLALELARTSPRIRLDGVDPGAETDVGKRMHEAMSGRTRILLQGAAGSGKTTLMQWLAVRTAQGDLPPELSRLENRVPFVIPLRALGDMRRGPEAEQLPSALGYPAAAAQPPNWSARLFRQGRGLLLVDGIDEILREHRPRVRSWLEGFLSLYPETAVVATSRTSAIPYDWLPGYAFTTLSVLPMSPADVDRFIDRWFGAMADKPEWHWARDQVEGTGARVREQLATRPNLAQLAANPRLCTLICKTALLSGHRPPESPLSLHEAALDLLLHRRDAQRGFAATEGVHLHHSEQGLLFEALASWMVVNDQTDMGYPRARKIIRRAGPRSLRTKYTEAVLQHLVVRSGILRDVGDDSFAFEHSTFRDYFAGRAFAADGHVGFLVKNAHDPAYEDVVRMTAGHCQGRDADSLLAALVARGDREPVHRMRLHVLAASCLDYTVQVDPAVRAAVSRRVEVLMPPDDDAAADVLAEVGPMALPLLPTPDGLSADQARAVVLTACKIGGPGAVAVLERFAAFDDSVVRERVRWGRERVGSPPASAFAD